MDDRTSVFVDAVQTTRERMYRVARMMLRTDADAEDAVSVVYKRNQGGYGLISDDGEDDEE